MSIHKRYTFDLTEFGTEPDFGHAVCTANEGEDEWVCDMTLDLDDLPKRELKAIRDEVRRQFDADLRREFGVKRLYWKGDRRSPLLRYQKGDRVSFKGGSGEIVYVIPESSLGVRTPDGRVLNFHLKSLTHFLFKRIGPM